VLREAIHVVWRETEGNMTVTTNELAHFGKPWNNLQETPDEYAELPKLICLRWGTSGMQLRLTFDSAPGGDVPSITIVGFSVGGVLSPMRLRQAERSALPDSAESGSHECPMRYGNSTALKRGYQNILERASVL
jgi:hypothetical protein